MSVFNLKNKHLRVSVNSFGAELSSVYSELLDIEYLWQADEKVWARHAPNLFPIVGKLKNGEYSFNSKTYQLSQHGFARDCEFQCIDQTENTLVFELTSSQNSLLVFPFEFSFKIKYELLGNKVIVSYSVFNPANDDLFFSVGAHPAFNCPLQTIESFNDYHLVFPNQDNLVINELSDGLIASKTKNINLVENRMVVSKELFDNDALVFCNNQINEVKLVSVVTKHGVSLTSKNWPYFGIWTKKGIEKFVCLEPWYGIADSDISNGNIIDKAGIIKLDSNKTFDCSFEMVFF
jgi:galactose mutarotase-like enzyme